METPNSNIQVLLTYNYTMGSKLDRIRADIISAIKSTQADINDEPLSRNRGKVAFNVDCDVINSMNIIQIKSLIHSPEVKSDLGGYCNSFIYKANNIIETEPPAARTPEVTDDAEGSSSVGGEIER